MMSNLINLKNIVYQVDNKYILKDISCHINKNGILSILGPNGAGKTTLLKIMAGLIKPTSGSIKFNYKLPIGFVFQKPVLLNRSVEYNLMHALKYSIRPQTDKSKELANHILNENRLSYLKDKPAKKISGGEQQLISILRACIIKPEVLFFDEPTSNLDTEFKNTIEELILSASKRTKVIIVSQDQVMARKIADELLFLDRGTLRSEY